MTEQALDLGDRFRVLRRLGAGGFGVVYAAFDNARSAPVALKTLREMSPAALYRLKREFRALADMVHPNLVELYELLSRGDQWFFTMEIVDGVTFLEYLWAGRPAALPTESALSALPTIPVRNTPTTQTMMKASGPLPPAPPANPAPKPQIAVAWDAVRVVVTQLVEGVAALHAAGKLHCDIKPGNVLIGNDGRVVLLDFGLVHDLQVGSTSELIEIVGTPIYMSPEQGSGRALTGASDWYSLGVMLYEAMTGARPFTATGVDLVVQKEIFDPPPPQAHCLGIPDDLQELCVELLRRDPEQRPSARDILQRLRAGAQVAVAEPHVVSHRGDLFVGRRREMSVLREAFDAARRGALIATYVHGSSGMGKTALVQHFVQELQQEVPEVLVLTGRCHERESVPYKALDSLVDALTEHLAQLPFEEAQALLPPHVAELVRLFPVLGRVEAVAESGRADLEVLDSLERRRRAFAALRDLLTRVGRKVPLVLIIDDLQWGDVDSAVLLAEVVQPPDPPPLLLIATYRTEEAETSPVLKTFLTERANVDPGRREVVVGELDGADARDLAVSLVGDLRGDAAARAEAIAREASGSPFLIDALARYAPAPGTAAAETTLDTLIAQRVATLADAPRRLLTVLAVAGQPIDVLSARQAADVTPSDHHALSVLRQERLIRKRVTRDREEIETYHDRIRETVVAGLSPGALLRHHERLATALEASGHADPETLAVHFQAAGQRDRAARYAVLAAQQASAALAFNRAARLYRLALDLAPGDDDNRRALLANLGTALANAGRGAEAARAFRGAADGAEAEIAVDLLRRAAQQLLVSGHMDEGLQVLKTVLTKVGIALPQKPVGSLIRYLLRRALLRVRGLSFKERREDDVPMEERLKVDAAWSAAEGLALVHPVHGAAFQALHLILALRSGEPYRIVRALALDVAYSAGEGRGNQENTAKLLRLARDLTTKAPQPHAQAMVTLATGMAAYLEGRWMEGGSACSEAAVLLRERCTGVAWEMDTAHIFLMRSLVYMGEIAEMARNLPALEKETRDRGDLYGEVFLGTDIAYLVHLANDEPEKAEPVALATLARWPHKHYDLAHHWALHARTETALYTGAGESAWKVVTADWTALRESLLLRMQLVRIISLDFRARAALAAAAGAGGQRSAMLRAAAADARRIRKEKAPWGEAMALLVLAGVAAGRDAEEECVSYLVQAEAAFKGAGMRLHAAAASRRLAKRRQGAEAEERLAATTEIMSAEGIRNPDRMTAMLAPGPWSRS